MPESRQQNFVTKCVQKSMKCIIWKQNVKRSETKNMLIWDLGLLCWTFQQLLAFILLNTLQNWQLSGTQTDSFRVLRQSLNWKFCGFRNPRNPAFRMALQVIVPFPQPNEEIEKSFVNKVLLFLQMQYWTSGIWYSTWKIHVKLVPLLTPQNLVDSGDYAESSYHGTK